MEERGTNTCKTWQEQGTNYIGGGCGVLRGRTMRVRMRLQLGILLRRGLSFPGPTDSTLLKWKALGQDHRGPGFNGQSQLND